MVQILPDFIYNNSKHRCSLVVITVRRVSFCCDLRIICLYSVVWGHGIWRLNLISPAMTLAKFVHVKEKLLKMTRFLLYLP